MSDVSYTDDQLKHLYGYTDAQRAELLDTIELFIQSNFEQLRDADIDPSYFMQHLVTIANLYESEYNRDKGLIPDD